MDRTLREDADAIIASSLKAVLPDEAVRRALAQFRPGRGRVLLVAAGKAAWQMTHAAVEALSRVDGGVVVTKYGHVKGEIPGVICCEAGHPVPDENGFAATEKALELVHGPAVPDTSTCAQAQAVAEKYHLQLSARAKALLAQETPKALDNVTTRITGSVRELCAAAADACRARGYEPLLLTDRLCCEAREAGSFLGTIARTHAGQGKKLAFLAGGETVVHLTGKGLGGRSQELALAAAPAIAGQKAAVFSVGSDGTDGPTDAAGGYVDGDTAAALAARGLRVFDVLQNNDAYHALQAVGGLIVTGATGTNVNDVAVALVEGE